MFYCKLYSFHYFPFIIDFNAFNADFILIVRVQIFSIIFVSDLVSKTLSQNIAARFTYFGSFGSTAQRIRYATIPGTIPVNTVTSTTITRIRAGSISK